MENLSQFGIAGLALGIIYFIVQYFIKTMEKKDDAIHELTNKFIKVTEDTNKSHTELTTAIETNTKATKESSEMSRVSNDNLTKLVLKILKNHKK